MSRFIISFKDGDMVFPESELPAVADAAHAVMREAKQAGVWIFGGGFQGFNARLVSAYGTVAAEPEPPYPPLGGFAIVDVESWEEAERWAQKLAVACRCPQQVRRFMDDPEA